MRLRARNARPSVRPRGAERATNGLAGVMKNTMQRAFIASLAAAALMLAADASFARSGVAPAAGVRAMPPATGHAFRAHRRNFGAPLVGGYYYGPDNAPLLDVAPSQPGGPTDVRYTYTQDVP